mmetsp:Transcript_16071/g.53492  ORF Transcript_16071/g.53492 Transcript_16071/m.53492 type:complete len:496 (-) Transcript_16071:118-1605(-)
MAADAGYELLLANSLETVRRECFAAPGLTHSGVWLIPAVGRFDMGGRDFTCALDAFGKWHKFELDSDRGAICFTAEFMQTGFFNESTKAGTVGAGMLFSETVPPRPLAVRLRAMTAPNDNAFVNTISVGGQHVALTDSPDRLAFSLSSLAVRGKLRFDSSARYPRRALYLETLGSAHPVPRPGSQTPLGLSIAVRTPFMDQSEVSVYAWSGPTTRELLARLPVKDRVPYLHSFGVLRRAVLLPLQPLSVDMRPALFGTPLQGLMRELSVNTTFVVLPLAGGGTSLRTFNAGGRYFFTHVINTYEEGEGDAATLVFDACVSHLNPFHSTAIAIAAQRNKTRRDAGGAMMHARRFVIRIAGPRRGEVVSSLLSRAGREADFPQIDSRYRGRKHCIYWAVLWRADGVAYGAMAIDRTDVCRGKVTTWMRPASFPSEPTFLASGEEEGQGALLVTVLNGTSGRSSFLTLDATTMQPTLEVPLPVRIPFTTHGQWYPPGG